MYVNKICIKNSKKIIAQNPNKLLLLNLFGAFHFTRCDGVSGQYSGYSLNIVSGHYSLHGVSGHYNCIYSDFGHYSLNSDGGPEVTNVRILQTN